MFSFLQNHPFAVDAFFSSSIVLTFAVDKSELENLIPHPLSLDTFQGKYAFIAIAFVKTKNLRPKGFSKFMGHNFKLVGYRIFVRYKSNNGKSLRGLYILKSETDKKKMELLGNIFTSYNYTTTDILESKSSTIHRMYSLKSKFDFQYSTVDLNPSLPPKSPFENWKEARHFSGPLPNTFFVNEAKSEIIIIEGLRQNWTPKPIQIFDYHFDFLDSLQLNSPILANAFIVENVPYSWKKGRIEKLINEN